MWYTFSSTSGISQVLPFLDTVSLPMMLIYCNLYRTLYHNIQYSCTFFPRHLFVGLQFHILCDQFIVVIFTDVCTISMFCLLLRSVFRVASNSPTHQIKKFCEQISTRNDIGSCSRNFISNITVRLYIDIN